MKHIKHRARQILIATFAIVIATTSLAPAAMAQSAQDNPSGKYRGDGSPLLTKPLSEAAASKKRAQHTTPFAAECPPTIKCVVIPAAYEKNGDNPLDYGNYDTANRTKDMSINSVVIHDTEGDLQSVLDAFQNPAFYASSHYVIASDGTVYQMVQNKDIAWHAGNWWYNMHSIGIEHVGHAVRGSTEYTPAMYKSSAELVKWLSKKYGIERDRQHVVGHDNVPPTTGAGLANMHVDPGPYWNWQNYMARMGAPVVPSAGIHSKMVTIAPTWPLSKEAVTGCWPDPATCITSDQNPTNFVYIRTEPRVDAPMVADPVLGQGTTDIGNNAARAFHGQTFVVTDKKLDRKGIWYQIWYNGAKGWFYSPWSAPTAFPAKGKYATAKNESSPLYGRPLPEQSEYPADFVPAPGAVTYPTPLPYTLGAGQKYRVIDANVKNDFYYAWSVNDSLPYDHTVFTGQTKYSLIEYGSRQYFVKQSGINIQ